MGGLIIHKCPSCGSQVEKNEGCPHMYCSVCNHSWCWICGLSIDSWIHFEIGFGGEDDDGTICHLINEEFIENKNKIIIKVLLAILLFIILPIIGAVLVPLYVMMIAYHSTYYRYNKVIKWLLNVFIIPFGIVLGLVIYFIGLIVIEICFIATILVIFFNWCIKSRRVRQSQ